MSGQRLEAALAAGSVALIPRRLAGDRHTGVPPGQIVPFVHLDDKLRSLHRAHAEGLGELAREFGSVEVAQRRSVVGMQELFNRWAAHGYDAHMEGHDTAVRELLRMLIGAIHMARVEHGQSPIFGGKVLEASCGTGTVIRSIVDIMKEVDPGGLKSMRVTGNDLSHGMQEQARAKLADVDVVFTQQDLRELRTEKQHVIILSQTLHLIADPEKLERERNGEEALSDHRQIKTDVIKTLFRQLEDDGFFVLIDEWPAILSRNRSTLEPGIEAAFEEQFRPIESREDLRDRIMATVPGARFGAEFKIKIDLAHSMTLFLYQKDPLAQTQRQLPDTTGHAKKCRVKLTQIRRAKAEASERMNELIKRLDDIFVSRYQPVNGERAMWQTVKRLSQCDPERVFDTRKDGIAIPNREFDAILMADVLHYMSDAERSTFISEAMKHLAKGGALVVMDMWKPPQRSPYPTEKRHVRNLLIGPYEERLLFEGAMRIPIMPVLKGGRKGFTDAQYAWVYRRKN